MLRQIIGKPATSNSDAESPQQWQKHDGSRRGARSRRTGIYLSIAAGVVAAGWLLLPWVQKRRAVSQLTDAGLTWMEDSRYVRDAGGVKGMKTVDGILPALRRLQPETLELSLCPELTHLEGLNDIASLEHLRLTACESLMNPDGLRGLPSLWDIDVSACPALTHHLDGLKSLPALRSLHVRWYNGPPLTGGFRGASPANLDSLAGLTGLRILRIDGWDALTNVDALRSLPGLENLSLTSCHALTNLDGLKALTVLEDLSLKGNPVLKDADPLKHLKSLLKLDLSECPALTNVNGLRGLTVLEILELGGCKALTGVDGLEGLTRIRSLDLSHCDALTNLDAVRSLTGLQGLSLDYCANLPEEAWRGVMAALPDLRIKLPDGSVTSGTEMEREQKNGK